MPHIGKPRPTRVSKIGRPSTERRPIGKPSPIGKRPIGKPTRPMPADKPIKSLERERGVGRVAKRARPNSTIAGRAAKRAAPMSREELRFIGEAKAGAKRGSRFDSSQANRTKATPRVVRRTGR